MEHQGAFTRLIARIFGNNIQVGTKLTYDKPYSLIDFQPDDLINKRALNGVAAGISPKTVPIPAGSTLSGGFYNYIYGDNANYGNDPIVEVFRVVSGNITELTPMALQKEKSSGILVSLLIPIQSDGIDPTKTIDPYQIVIHKG